MMERLLLVQIGLLLAACSGPCSTCSRLPGEHPVVVASPQANVQWWRVHDEAGIIAFDWTLLHGGVFSYFSETLESGGVRDGATARFRFDTNWRTEPYLGWYSSADGPQVAPLLVGLNPNRYPSNYVLLGSEGRSAPLFSCAVSIDPELGGAEAADELWIGLSRDCADECANNWSTALYRMNPKDLSGALIACVPPDPLAPARIALHPSQHLIALSANNTLRVARFEADAGVIEVARGSVDLRWMEFDPTSERLIVNNSFDDAGTSIYEVREVSCSDGGVIADVSPLNEKFAVLVSLQPIRSGFVVAGNSRTDFGDNRETWRAAYVEGGVVRSEQLFPRLGARSPQFAEQGGAIYVFQEPYPPEDGGTQFLIYGMRLDL